VQQGQQEDDMGSLPNSPALPSASLPQIEQVQADDDEEEVAEMSIFAAAVSWVPTIDLWRYSANSCCPSLFGVTVVTSFVADYCACIHALTLFAI
jgi:hypothetical protein